MYKTIYKYQIGDIITDVKSGKLKILEQVRIGKKNIRGYKYKCLICGNKDAISESNLKNNHNGCNVCSGRKALKDYNDIASTNPELAKLLADPNDGYKYKEHSNKQTDWRCPICGNIIKNKKISDINRQGLSCPRCSDKLPYPEKFVYSFLQQLLGNNFMYQLSKTIFKWIDNYRYDFYFKINNESCILEVHGKQHYQETYIGRGKGRSFQEEQENDKLKKN